MKRGEVGAVRGENREFGDVVLGQVVQIPADVPRVIPEASLEGFHDRLPLLVKGLPPLLFLER